ncbi:MAG: alkaline serine protease, partial [Actinomycetia bacterium]|nr:alkaline serine protease [Actinomycetes bacterium]
MVLVLALGLAGPASAATPTPWVVKVSDVRALAGLGPRLTTVADDTFVVRSARRPSGPAVVWAVPDTTYTAARIPTDPCFLACGDAIGGQPELRAIGAPAAWDVTTGSPTITVAVLDTLAEVTHPDLAGNVVRGPDFVTERCGRSTPAAGHGTAVAGVVGARTDNAQGVASLGWQTRVLSIGVLDECGDGSASAVARGVRYAVDAGARVLNLSLAGDASPVLGDAVAYARQRGVLVVAAAGNEGVTTPSFPAAYPGVVGVAATDAEATRLSSFSNHGSWVDVAAPGEDIVSTAPGGLYGSFTGTSFSSPLVAAAAALVLARHPDWDGDDVAVRLARSARRVPGVEAPVLDAAAAVAERPGGAVLAAADGGAFAFGSVGFKGSAVPSHPRRPIVGVAAAGAGGYWLVAGDGGIFSFGDARFFGSTGSLRLQRPIVGMAATPTGRGYWLVASDGGVFTFGDARFAGSGAGAARAPIVGMAAASAGSYWLAAADGAVLAFGGAPALGSGRAGTVGIAAGPGGYWLGTGDGHLLPFGAVADD